MFWDFNQGINSVIYRSKQGPVEGFCNENIGSLYKGRVYAVFIKKFVEFVFKVNAMAVIHFPPGKNRKKQINFFILRLLIEDGFSKIYGKSKLCIEFF